VIVVPDAGPLIYLGGAGQLELLRLLYAEVVVPRVVLEEVVVTGVGLTGADEVARATWLRIDDAAPDPGVLLAAKRRQLLAEVAPVIARMEVLGMFVSVRLREEVLRIAGEKG
jgi:predicted nucleic acid-binding protein